MSPPWPREELTPSRWISSPKASFWWPRGQWAERVPPSCGSPCANMGWSRGGGGCPFGQSTALSRTPSPRGSHCSAAGSLLHVPRHHGSSPLSPLPVRRMRYCPEDRGFITQDSETLSTCSRRLSKARPALLVLSPLRDNSPQGAPTSPGDLARDFSWQAARGLSLPAAKQGFC